ncbi:MULTISPECIES: putative collagen-binding domain-containing protein [unclassified Pseudonocardia]|uniref:putative collagen-binding domain-containing protein n=1 Tax=unclassified Pseudonocardia TaxID=2619320 RepID=UPI00143BC974|nr:MULTISPECIES: putative collagen-binding domain-containing protein [unclassified Pseudonocardia]
MVGTVLVLAGALAGTHLAVAAAVTPAGPGADRVARTALSPYRDGAFTVRAAAVDRRVGVASAEDGSYVLGHTPAGGDVVLDLDLLAGDTARPWWVEPATGRTLELAVLASVGVARFPVPDGGGREWVLVVDDAAAGYGAPDADAVADTVAGTAGETARPAPGSGDPASGETGSGDPDRAGDGPTSGTDPEHRRFPGDPAPTRAPEPAPAKRAPAKPAPAEPAPAAKPGPAAEQKPDTPDAAVWDRLSRCESSGDWQISTGNGYYGVIRTDPLQGDADHCPASGRSWGARMMSWLGLEGSS